MNQGIEIHRSLLLQILAVGSLLYQQKLKAYRLMVSTAMLMIGLLTYYCTQMLVASYTPPILEAMQMFVIVSSTAALTCAIAAARRLSEPLSKIQGNMLMDYANKHPQLGQTPLIEIAKRDPDEQHLLGKAAIIEAIRRLPQMNDIEREHAQIVIQCSLHEQGWPVAPYAAVMSETMGR